MNYQERRRLELLKRRVQWLQKRIEKAEQAGTDTSYDKAELSALEWAITVVTDTFKTQEPARKN